jgi:type 1 fimbriae regulatory protein FimB/type 1 fimbriae regulatory protein FimE
MSLHQCVVLPFPVRARPQLKVVRSPNLQRLTNSAYRSREYLTEREVEQLRAAALQTGRHGQRDATLILLAYRHGLRVTELVNLRWEQLDFEQGLIHINRIKRGTASVHPLGKEEIAALQQLRSMYPLIPQVFTGERKTKLSADVLRKIITRAGRVAELPFTVHPHMLRHACGYKLAQDGQDTRAIQHYLGHKNIQHTVRYTQLSSERFKDFWKD